MRRRERDALERHLRAEAAAATKRATAAEETARIAERQREQAQGRVVDLSRELRRSEEARAILEGRLADMQRASEARDWAVTP